MFIKPYLPTKHYITSEVESQNDRPRLSMKK